jgi:hypothetical protein
VFLKTSPCESLQTPRDCSRSTATKNCLIPSRVNLGVQLPRLGQLKIPGISWFEVTKIFVCYECSFAHSVDLTHAHVNSLKINSKSQGMNALFQYTHPAAIGQLYIISTHHPPIYILMHLIPMVQMLTPPK